MRYALEREEYQYHLWEHARLSQTSIDHLRSLPYALDLNVEGVRIYLVYAHRLAELPRRAVGQKPLFFQNMKKPALRMAKSPFGVPICLQDYFSSHSARRAATTDMGLSEAFSEI